MIKIPGVPEPKHTRYIAGYFSENIISALSLNISNNTPIYIATNNREHIRSHHSDAYIKYFEHLENILSSPDYVGFGGVKIPSIEFIKIFDIDNEYVNVAVRATAAGVYYVRSMFIINESRVEKYIQQKGFVKLTNL